MRTFDTAIDSIETIHAALTERDHAHNAEIEATVRAIIDDVKTRGDAAVLDYTRRFDWPEATLNNLMVLDPSAAFEDAWDALSPELERSLRSAEDNIRLFHLQESGHLHSWMDFHERGRNTGQILQAVNRVGVYIPGGKAVYPSTVLMAVLPASVAGVEEFVICTPPDKTGEISPIIKSVIHRAIDLHPWSIVAKIGGAQAIAAMAYGTELVPKCDVIVGPGNAYVNTAKRLVYGEVGIDMLAGPSEVAIVADEDANPAFIAADLLAQTEHGPDNKGVLFTFSSNILEKCKIELVRQREQLSRKEILEHTAQNLIFVKTNSLEQALELSNVLAPEHLELMVREPLAVLPLVKNAGAVLLGQYTSASIGDYWAGPSHTLPTAGAAHFSSPLSVATFMKRTSVIYYSQQAAQEAAEDVARFAEAEGFDAHAHAARLRSKPSPSPLGESRGEVSIPEDTA